MTYWFTIPSQQPVILNTGNSEYSFSNERQCSLLNSTMALTRQSSLGHDERLRTRCCAVILKHIARNQHDPFRRAMEVTGIALRIAADVYSIRDMASGIDDGAAYHAAASNARIGQYQTIFHDTSHIHARLHE